MKMAASKIAVLGFVMTLVSSAWAHGPASQSSKASRWNPARLGALPSERIANTIPTKSTVPGLPHAPAFVIVLPSRWAAGQMLQICFRGGDGALRDRIIAIGRQWLNYANLRFDSGPAGGRDCKDQDTSQIRIGFTEPGYWSYVGNDSLNPQLVQNSLASMNFDGFDSQPPADPYFTAVVLHEFGHALGFHHEHQSPAEGCDAEYKWPELYAWYLDKYNWDSDMVDRNVREFLKDRRAYDWSAPDPASIMVYASDPDFLVSGIKSKCYFAQNYAISAGDILGAQRTYPYNNVGPHLANQINNLQAVIPQTSGPLNAVLKRQLELTIRQSKIQQ